MRPGQVAAALCVATLVTSGVGRSQTPASPLSPWNAFLSEFLAEPHRSVDLTPQHFQDELTRTKAQLAELRALDPASLSPEAALDRRFAESVLVGRQLEQERMRRWRMDPRLYTSSLDATVATLDAKRSADDPAARAAVLLDALRAIPAELLRGRNNLTLNVARFRDQSLASAKAAATTTFTTDVPAFAEGLPAQKAALLAANAAAQRAVAEWVDFLTTYLPDRPRGSFAIGIETYDAMLRGQHLLDFDSADLYQYERREFDRTIGELEAVAHEFDADKTWQDIANESPAESADAPPVLPIDQMNNASPLRRAMRSPLTVEGWALYREQIAQETSASTEAPTHLRQLQLKLWRIARVLADVGLHTGKLTESEATTMMTARVGLAKSVADLEIAAVADAPGAHLGYVGLVEILRIRDDMQAQRGVQFSVDEFNDRLQKIGPLPPALLRAALAAR